MDMSDSRNITEILCAIQSELNIEKKRKNHHYDYSYRNAEDIMAGIKPVLKKYRVALSLGQDIKEVAGCIFLQIILCMRYHNKEIKNNYFCPIQAPSKQGQSMSQAFGATISYANKYALASMFLLDEGMDSDSINGHSPVPKMFLSMPIISIKMPFILLILILILGVLLEMRVAIRLEMLYDVACEIFWALFFFAERGFNFNAIALAFC